jgi:hypothetical protein
MFGPAEGIAFVGILVTASVSLIGYLLNRQSERHLADESRRAEDRLRKMLKSKISV